jgi:molecular chaperone GrpE
MSKNENSKKTTWEKLNAAAQLKETKNNAIEEEVENKQEVPKSETKTPAQLSHPSYEALEKQLNKTEALLEEHKNKLLQYQEQDAYRLAEIENIRRRSKQEVDNTYKFALEKMIKELLPVKDSLEAALAIIAETKNSSILTGTQLTLKALQKVLEQNGVTTLDPNSGEAFNPYYHQAMLTEESPDQAPNTILKVLQKGYLLHGRLLRPALVVVVKAVGENA